VDLAREGKSLASKLAPTTFLVANDAVDQSASVLLNQT
jgi:hypothetical protein